MAGPGAVDAVVWLRTARMEQALEEVVYENDFLRQQRGDILAALMDICCDPKLGSAHVLRISELIQHVSLPRRHLYPSFSGVC